MKNQLNLCQTCLSSGRQLVSTSRIRVVLKEIQFDEFENYTSICWECHSIILKFYKFRLQVRNAQNYLRKREWKPLSNLSFTSKNSFDFKFVYNHDPLTNIPAQETKCEIEKIKEETLMEVHKSPAPSHSESEDEKKLEVKRKVTKDKPKKKRPLKQRKVKEVDPSVLKEKFKTVLLTEEELLKSREEKRNQPNYKKIPYKCDMCVLGFTTKNNYDLHVEKKHNETAGANICKVCSTRFSTVASLQRHRIKHYQYHACTLCEYRTSALKAAMNHCRDKHERDDVNRIHCKQCTAVLRTPGELAEHTKTEHTLYCNDCGDAFKGKHTLRTHLIRIHSVKREFPCTICNKSFLTKSRLESHSRAHSAALAARLAYCAPCRVQYKDIHVYRSHVRNSTRHVLDRYQCPDCNKKFASKVYWNKHYKFYHLKRSPYKCEACNKLFISKWRLKNHRQKHHGLTRTRDHGCNVCGKKFYTLPTLRGHQLTHSSQRLYMCEDCGDTFRQRPALHTHARLVHRRGRGARAGGGEGAPAECGG